MRHLVSHRVQCFTILIQTPVDSLPFQQLADRARDLGTGDALRPTFVMQFRSFYNRKVFERQQVKCRPDLGWSSPTYSRGPAPLTRGTVTGRNRRLGRKASAAADRLHPTMHPLEIVARALARLNPQPAGARVMQIRSFYN
jgi:hypothetical protein